MFEQRWALPVTTIGGDLVRLHLQEDGAIRITLDPVPWLPTLTLDSDMAYRLGTQLRELSTR